MAKFIEKQEEFVLTRKQFEDRKLAGTLVVGAKYHITDDPTPQDIIDGVEIAKIAETDTEGNVIATTYRRKDDSYSAKETQDKLDTKVDIIKDKVGLYLQQADGTVTIKQMASGEAKAWTVAERSTGGTLYVGTPTENSHAATKQYVDAADTTLQTNINTVDKKLETPVLKDFAINHNADNVSITNTYVNLNTAEETNDTKNINLVDESTAGLMSTGDYKTLRDLSTRVGNLEGKTTRLLYTEKTDPSAEDIQKFIDSFANEHLESEYKSPYEGLTIVIDETFHIWRYYENDNIGWRDDGVDSVHQFTNETKGIILGSTQDGKIYAETDGTGSVNGWSNLVNNVETNTRNIEQNKQDISTNAGNIQSINERKINGHTFNQDVTLNMTDIEDNENYVKFTDYAVDKGSAGIVYTDRGTYGVGASTNGLLFIDAASAGQIKDKQTTYRPITPNNLDYAIKIGLTTNTETLTDEEKATAQNWLDVPSNADVDTAIANIRKEVQNISSLETIYNDFADLPILDAAKNGTRYVTKTNGALPLKIYDWWYDTQEWKLVDQIRGSTIYIDLNTGLTYRYRSISPYLFPTSYTKTSQLENDVPFATEQYVDENGGKIDTVSVNGTQLEIDENKNVNISVPVQDVKVNGTSVLSNKVANIEVGKLSFSETSQDTSETLFTENIVLHKIAKTGNYGDLLGIPEVIDNLNSESTTDVLSANQGRQLKTLIQGIAQGKSYTDIEDLITKLNAHNKEDLTVGSSLYILQQNVPDFWITEVVESAATFTYTTDDEFLALFNTSATVQVGHYKIAINETNKVDLNDYATRIYVEGLFDDLNTRLTAVEENKVDKSFTGSYTKNTYTDDTQTTLSTTSVTNYITEISKQSSTDAWGNDEHIRDNVGLSIINRRADTLSMDELINGNSGEADMSGITIADDGVTIIDAAGSVTDEDYLTVGSQAVIHRDAVVFANIFEGEVNGIESMYQSAVNLDGSSAHIGVARMREGDDSSSLTQNMLMITEDVIGLQSYSSDGVNETNTQITLTGGKAYYNDKEIATVDMVGQSSSMTIVDWTEE